MASAQAFVPNSIIGKWKGTDSRNKIGQIEFIDEKSLLLTIPGINPLKCEYSLDKTKDPIWFDIIITNSNKQVTLVGILKFIDEDNVKWQPSFDDIRKETFDEESTNNMMILTREKN